MNMKSILYNQQGEKTGEIQLPENIFDVPMNFDLLHQAVRYYRNLQRRAIAKTKDRAEVRGGGKKPWKQKGTGRARHGSIRSPIWRGGGVTFGPNPEKKYLLKIPKRMRRKALNIVLSQKLKDGEIVFLDKIDVSAPKTKLAADFLCNLSKIKKDIEKKKTMIVLHKKNENILKSTKNIACLSVIIADSSNTYSFLKNKYLVIEEDAVKEIKNRFAVNPAKKKWQKLKTKV